ncbi:hypothetical protein OAP63_14270 [Vibrio sp.]|nr:hypothetical protein [Vibrio sp.]
MIAAWKWIKWAGLAGLVVVIVVLWLSLDISKTKRLSLQDDLQQAQADNQSNLITIATLKNDAQANNELLVKRQREQIEHEQTLNTEIDELKARLSTIQCVIPGDVTQRLREPY